MNFSFFTARLRGAQPGSLLVMYIQMHLVVVSLTMVGVLVAQMLSRVPCTIKAKRVDKSRNRLLREDSHEKCRKPFLLFYESKIEMWVSHEDSHSRKSRH